MTGLVDVLCAVRTQLLLPEQTTATLNWPQSTPIEYHTVPLISPTKPQTAAPTWPKTSRNWLRLCLAGTSCAVDGRWRSTGPVSRPRSNRSVSPTTGPQTRSGSVRPTPAPESLP